MVTDGTYDYATLACVNPALSARRRKRSREVQYLLIKPSPNALDKPGSKPLKSQRRWAKPGDANKTG